MINAPALFTLFGSIVGVGIFALPYLASKAGIAVGAGYLIVFGVLMALVHLLYMEVVLRTKEKHRLIGYARRYLGLGAGRLALVSVTFSLYAALLAYVVLATDFLRILFPQISPNLIALFFVGINGAFIARGIKLVSRGETIFSWLLIALVGVLFAASWQYPAHSAVLLGNIAYFYLPYGAVLFAYDGTAVIPEIRDLFSRTGNSARKFFWSIGGAVAAAGIVYMIFMFAVLRITSSPATDALSGLSHSVSPAILSVIIILGVLNIITSFLGLGLNLRNTLRYDLAFSDKLAFAAAIIMPYALYLAGIRNFLAIIGFAGAVMTGINGMLIVLMHMRARRLAGRTPEFSVTLPAGASWAIVIVFALGILYTIVKVPYH